MFSRMVRPLKRRYDKYAGKVSGFVVPVKNAVVGLLGYVPGVNAFAGSEDLAEGESEGATPARKLGLLDRLKNFKKSLKEMSDFQKLILLTIAICLPAGILIATMLVGLIKRQKR